MNKPLENKLKKYYIKINQMRKKARAIYEATKIERMLRNLPNKKFSFNPPPRPSYRLFISKICHYCSA